MPAKDFSKQPIALIKTAVITLFTRPEILFPFAIIGFIQMLVFEILLFAPRHPLRTFFGPLIQKTEGEIFLHYPFNFLLSTKWFQNTTLQSLLFVLFGSLFIGMFVSILNTLNNEETLKYRVAFRRALQSYVHLATSAVVMVGFMLGLSQLHGLVVQRAIRIGATAGIKFFIKKAVLLSVPYVNLLLAVLVTAFFIYLIPIIIIEKKKIFPALVANFKTLGGSFWFTLTVVLLPAVLYIPLILLRQFAPYLQKNVAPEILIAIGIVGILITIAIDAIHYTAVTTYYLLRKEEK